MIRQEDIAKLTLEQMLGDDEEGKSDFRCTKNLMGAYLFSRYQQRSDFAKSVLNLMWGTHIEIHTIEEDGIIYAYIEFNHLGKYVLVQKYSSDSPILENVPSETEKNLWVKLGNSEKTG